MPAFGAPAGGVAGVHGDDFPSGAFATVEAEGLLLNVVRAEELLRRGIEELKHPSVREVRGVGLLLGVALTEPVAARIQRAAQEAGFLVNAAGAWTVRLARALTVTETEIAQFVGALPAILGT
ncbi:aminotransferase class III-fold pyridoxal phosphate-dependent enzyme [Streptomyces sp. NPDC058572]|uniref:aminotransferase class III-fold pyridoxal phosphate-dependent enzyme n=1 Tax=Streptomyces sp. NPDC058572 TaxID=3346546 RepID=UPI0036679198